MIYINLKDYKIPALGFGTWQLKGRECEDSLAKALQIGYRHIDTAQFYENEAEFGSTLKSSGLRREDIFVTTKVWKDSVQDGTLQKSVEGSLKKLKTDYIDLLLIHWPVREVPFVEQMKALQAVQKAGQAKLIGVSNFSVAQMKEVVEKIGAPIVTNQVEYHPFLSQGPVLGYVRRRGMFLTAYCPLARGKVAEEPLLHELGRKHGKTPGQITLRWLVQQDGVAAIPKASGEKHMRDNFDIFGFTLTAAEMQQIHGLARTDGKLLSHG